MADDKRENDRRDSGNEQRSEFEISRGNRDRDRGPAKEASQGIPKVDDTIEPPEE